MNVSVDVAGKQVVIDAAVFLKPRFTVLFTDLLQKQQSLRIKPIEKSLFHCVPHGELCILRER